MTVEVSDAERGPHRWARDLSTFAADLLRATTTTDALRSVIAAGRTLVPAADLVSVTLRRDDGTFETVACSGPPAERLDGLQGRLAEGPCLLAGRRPGPGVFRSSDVGVDPRVGRWGPAAARERVRGVLAVALFAHEDPPRVGALTFLSFRRGGLDAADRDVAVVLAAHAAAVLDARATGTAARDDADLRDALRHRDVIGQAKGILMEREGIDAEKAFGILESVSRRMNVKLSSVAHTIASRRVDL